MLLGTRAHAVRVLLTPPPPGLSPPSWVPPLTSSIRARTWGNQSHKMGILVFYKHWQRDADTRGGFGHRARARGCAPRSGSGFGMLHLAPIPSPGYVPLCHSRRHLLLQKLGSSPHGGGFKVMQTHACCGYPRPSPARGGARGEGLRVPNSGGASAPTRAQGRVEWGPRHPSDG